eukprot:2131583-Lingulodinium_polyedra.AAC.1
MASGYPQVTMGYAHWHVGLPEHFERRARQGQKCMRRRLRGQLIEGAISCARAPAARSMSGSHTTPTRRMYTI